MSQAEQKDQATTDQKVTKSPGRPKKAASQTSSEKLLETVQTMTRIIAEKKVRINHETQAASVDLGARSRPSGVQFRQLQIKADAGFIAVRLIEGFKPTHGGSEQRKPLFSLVVPVSEMEAYSLLQKRFFAYNLDTVVADADNFINILKETIRDANSFS